MKKRVSIKNGFCCEDFVSIDIETTGINADSDEIIRLSAIKWTTNGLKEQFDTWIKPTKPITEEVNNILGFIDIYLEDAPNLKKALKSFDKFIGKLPLVSFNMKFDLGFLKKAYLKILKKSLANKAYCILEQARCLSELDQKLKLLSYRFDNLIKLYLEEDIKKDNIISTALFDCYGVGLIYIEQKKKLKLLLF